MASLDYYEILGVPPTASLDIIREAYRKLSSFSHPDRFADDPTHQHWANERMKQINEAYEILRDRDKRSAYDQTRTAQTTQQTHQEQRRQQKTEPRLRCPLCEGRGETQCLTCGGRGNQLCTGCAGAQIVICPICHGQGSVKEADYWRLIAELERARRQAEEAAHQRAVAESERQQAAEARARWNRFAAVSWIVFLISLTTFLVVRAGADRAVQQLVARRLTLPASHARPQSVDARINAPSETSTKLPALRSLESRYSVEYRFVNQTGRPLKAYWVDYSGKEVYYATLPSGGSWTVATYVTHPWRFRDARTGRVAFTVIAKPRNTEVTLLPPKRQ